LDGRRKQSFDAVECVAAAETPSAKATARQFGAPANTDAFDRIK
jgi:hypothetical protein